MQKQHRYLESAPLPFANHSLLLSVSPTSPVVSHSNADDLLRLCFSSIALRMEWSIMHFLLSSNLLRQASHSPLISNRSSWHPITTATRSSILFFNCISSSLSRLSRCLKNWIWALEKSRRAFSLQFSILDLEQLNKCLAKRQCRFQIKNFVISAQRIFLSGMKHGSKSFSAILNFLAEQATS